MSDRIPPPEDFQSVLRDELREIERARPLRGLSWLGVVPDGDAVPARRRDSETRSREVRTPYEEAAHRNLLGLAFSGGGIRSATFNLGILQCLAKYGLVSRFDYLSTVSGGGYIGSWLTSWIKRTDLRTVAQRLKHTNPAARTTEPAEITYLRQYSNYLTPKTGLLSADTWTVAAIYIRNVLLNLTILVLMLGAVLLVPRLVYWLTQEVERGPAWVLFAALSLVVLMVGVASCWVFQSLGEIRAANQDKTAEARGKREYKWFARQGWIQIGIVVPGFVIAWFCIARAETLMGLSGEHLLYLAGGLTSIVLLQALISYGFKTIFLKASLFVVLSGMGGAALLWFGLMPLVREAFPWVGWPALGFLHPLEAKLIWGVPLTVLVFSVMVTLYVGLMGKILETDAREWWGRISAWMMVYSFAWVGLFFIAFGAQGFVDEVLEPLGASLLASGWIGSTLAGLLVGHSSQTNGKAPSGWLEIVAQLSPYVFIVGLLVTLSYVIAAAGTSYFDHPGCVFLVIVVALLIAGILSWRVSINDFSMYNFYRNRLTRCYLGASNRNRRPHPFTGFDPHEDHIRMGDLVVDPKKAHKVSPPPPETETDEEEDCLKKLPYDGPYYLVNTALNLVAGGNLAWQKRMAMSFFISPLYSGFDASMLGPGSTEDDSKQAESPKKGYFRTMSYRDGMPIGAAATISGAAASPNMGYHSSAPVAFLMTVFNVRLGRWIGNPASEKADRPGPELGLPYLFFELFGMTNADRQYVYLSDGGHFENLGIYELVRRRCRFIVACDAEEDGKLEFDALGNAIEKCRTDFGVNIEINVDPIRQTRDNPKEGRHCAVGTIDYGDGIAPGRLLYIKSSLNGDEPTDVLRYADQNPSFPHQSTLDQAFDETQFESYRALGYHIMDEVLAVSGECEELPRMQTEELFVRLDRQWHPPARRAEGVFTRHAQDYEKLIDEIRETPHLRFLDSQINPGLRDLSKQTRGAPDHEYWLPNTYYELRAGYYMCTRMIQLMESVYIDLDLDHDWDHPDNKGWMNLFQNWSWAGMLRTTWAVMSNVYGVRFRDFCERRLGLETGRVCLGAPLILDWGKKVRDIQLDQCHREFTLNFVEVLFAKTLADHLEQEGFDPSHEILVYPIVVRTDVPFRPAERSDLGVGFALVHNQQVLYLRIQDHLRGMGLGRNAVRALLDSRIMRVAHWPKGSEHVVVKMPKLEDEKGREDENVELVSAARMARFRVFFRTVRNEVGRPDLNEPQETSQNPNAPCP